MTKIWTFIWSLLQKWELHQKWKQRSEDGAGPIDIKRKKGTVWKKALSKMLISRSCDMIAQNTGPYDIMTWHVQRPCFNQWTTQQTGLSSTHIKTILAVPLVDNKTSPLLTWQHATMKHRSLWYRNPLCLKENIDLNIKD